MPPRSRKPNGPKPVTAIRHDDTRANLPTVDAQEFVTPEVEAAKYVEVARRLRERDGSLDPQLVWKGKYGDESESAVAESATLVADAPPIYIQEKIDPRVLIENLRKTATADEAEPELALFDTFDGLDELDLVDFYRHDANWSNRMILGDSLQVMGSLAEREDLRGKVQMIYIDPPYGIKFGSNWQASARKRDVKDGKVEDTAREAEQIKAFRDTWELGIHSYLSYLRDRLLVARELLTESGSCFVQIGDENVHLVRSVMDDVFGAENFAGQILFYKTSSESTAALPGVVDTLLLYAKRRDQLKFRPMRVAKTPGGRGAKQYTKIVDSHMQTIVNMSNDQINGTEPIPTGWQICRLGPLTSMGAQPARSGSYIFQGVSYPCPANRHWSYNPAPGAEMDRLAKLGRIRPSGKSLASVLLFDDNPMSDLDNVWLDTGTGSFTEDQIYVVQTAQKVAQRCILMSSDPGDLILDPTCGSGTTAYVAEQWGRRWITIDTSRVALALARQRLMGAKYPMYLLADSDKGKQKAKKEFGTEPTGGATNDIRRGFVYERMQHITLKSIANNPDIVEGMSREQIDAAIKRHADFETLYDRPYEDKNVVRVSGPFTVESLSPHRSLAFAGNPDDAPRGTISEQDAAEQPNAQNFEQSILDNLKRAGIQNGKRQERIEFESVDPYAGQYIQAVGVRKDSGADHAVRVGIAVGPQYGTVSQKFARDAVKEAIAAKDIDLLCVLGFAFDASTHEVTEADGVTVDTSSVGFAQVEDERSFGRIKLLLVRMNVDLLMGEDLKKTGAGNLFTVFGEPDIDLRHTDDGKLVVELRGVDVYDPTTGEVRSNDTDKIALWMIDTNYNGDSFFVRHCYFTGGGDPYKRLKTALKAEIDPDAWSSLYDTISRPFDLPATGAIAVKVINDYGDEVVKVLEVSS
ncbi:adenine-specific DNA-methyltransferase [Kineosphaera limosa]|uniref:Putative modification methylase n=1 Tax=Kineosphaera limosa NBRC 100340 TaxID=1184609 RepID=K6VL68_9MICO|nr:site-specific DNA-methyltransferase [Kineosphaera limosa]NYE00831.1 adenine-specific DNA-methyltransferase [Kineosphaera limosa]GAB96958.1 putative modification methylase [Kineosphaera limosa NBRC 100340]